MKKFMFSIVAATVAFFMLSLKVIGHALNDALFGHMARSGMALHANIFTALQPVLFAAAQEVANEPFGVVSAINTSFDDKGVAIGDVVKVPVAPTGATSDYTPAMQTTAGSDATASTIDVAITANKKYDWNITGEQLRSLENGSTDGEWVRQMIAQGMRALRNGAESDAVQAIKVGASRAYGTAGTNPFASDINAIADMRKILMDNGAPLADLQLCIDSTAGTAARKLGIIQQADQSGSDAERRSGNLLRQFGFAIRESAGITQHVKGDGSSYATSGSTAMGVRDVALVTGSGAVLAGDVVTFAADSANQYVIGSGITAPGTVSLNRPGSRIVIPTSNALTIGNSYTPNLAFERSAVVGVMRPPIIPANPLMTQTLISDSMGMTYLLVQIVGDGMVTWRLHLCYGFKVVNSAMVAILKG